MAATDQCVCEHARSETTYSLGHAAGGGRCLVSGCRCNSFTGRAIEPVTDPQFDTIAMKYSKTIKRLTIERDAATSELDLMRAKVERLQQVVIERNEELHPHNLDLTDRLRRACELLRAGVDVEYPGTAAALEATLDFLAENESNKKGVEVESPTCEDGGGASSRPFTSTSTPAVSPEQTQGRPRTGDSRASAGEAAPYDPCQDCRHYELPDCMAPGEFICPRDAYYGHQIDPPTAEVDIGEIRQRYPLHIDPCDSSLVRNYLHALCDALDESRRRVAKLEAEALQLTADIAVEVEDKERHARGLTTAREEIERLKKDCDDCAHRADRTEVDAYATIASLRREIDQLGFTVAQYLDQLRERKDLATSSDRTIDDLRAKLEVAEKESEHICDACGRDLCWYPCADDGDGAWDCEVCMLESRAEAAEAKLAAYQSCEGCKGGTFCPTHTHDEKGG